MNAQTDITVKPIAPIAPKGKGKKAMDIYNAEMEKYEADMIEWEKNNATLDGSEDEEEEYETEDGEEDSDEEDSEEETEDEPLTASIIIRETASFVAPPPADEEEDEEAILMREIAEEERIRKEANDAKLRAIRANKMRKDMTPIREEECGRLSITEERILGEMGKLKAELDAIRARKTETMRGDHDDALIAKKTATISTPAVKTASVKAPRIKANGKPDARTDPNPDKKSRPKTLSSVCKSNTQFRFVKDDAEFKVEWRCDKNRLVLMGGYQTPPLKYYPHKMEATGGGKSKCIGADTSKAKISESEWDTLSSWTKACQASRGKHTNSVSAPDTTEYLDKKTGEWMRCRDHLWEGATIN
jgi:hypothetical protein